MRLRRAPRVKTILKPGCVICKKRICIDELNCPYNGPITRRYTKLLKQMNEFIIIETYRCMPLLGDEEKNPNWDVHIVRYSIVFLESKSDIDLYKYF